MQDPIGFADLLILFAPLLAALWLWGLRRVLRDLRRLSPTGPAWARSGPPHRPLPPAPPRRLLKRSLIGPRYPRGHPAR